MWFFAGSSPIFHDAVFQVKINIACLTPERSFSCHIQKEGWSLALAFICSFPSLFMLPGIEQVLFTHGIVLGIQTLLVIYDSLSIRAILENEATCLDREEGAFWSGM